MTQAIHRIAGVLLLLSALGCQNSNLPERRDVFGSWVSRSLPDGTIRMTLTETARAVEGAGSFVTGNSADAFAATGAIADDEVSLLFRFDDRGNINFQGYFPDDDVMEGTLTGGGFNRLPVIFDREDLNDFR